MPASKGTNNFLKYRTEKITFIKDRIDAHLGNLRISKASFENRNQLAEYLCIRLTEDRIAEWKQGDKKTPKPKNMAKSTLYRNNEYAAKLDSFLAGAPLGRGIDANLVKTNLPMAQAKITEQKAEISNLKNRISILEKYIENSGVHEVRPSNTRLISDHPGSLSDFVQTARALSLLIEATEGQFIIENGNLKAAHRLINNIVADKATMAAFNKWFFEQDNKND